MLVGKFSSIFLSLLRSAVSATIVALLSCSYGLLYLLCHIQLFLEQTKKKLRQREVDNAAIAEILKGNPKYFGASLAPGHTHFSSGCGFMVGVGKPELCTKFEVPSFSHCVNIEVEPKNFEKLS